jgi:Plasmid pRiA4b ORF-3-like protein
MAKAKAKPKPKSPFQGRWHIASMSNWDEDYFNAEVQAYFEFEPNQRGQFRFGYVRGDIDYREGPRDGKPAVEFSFEGNDEMDPCSGRGWAVLDGEELNGMIFFHLGDESDFVAEKAGELDQPGGKTTKTADKGTVRNPAAKPSKRSKVVQATGTIYQLKIALKDIRPPIWRRILVPDCSLVELHEIIQVAMGWEDYHLFDFEVGGERYTDPRGMNDLDMEDASRARLSDIIPKEKFKFSYTYDFGDDWRHEVLVEKILPPEAGQKYPACLDGKRACPPEDVGGPWGYQEFVEAIRDPKHERHEELLDWSGEYEPEAFDLDSVNKELRRLR